MSVSWFWVAAAAVVAASIAAAVVFVRRSARARATGDSSPVVRIALVISAWWAAITVIGVAFGIVQTLSSPAPTMTVPVATFWPGLLPGVTIDGGPTASVTGGGFTQADVAVSGVSAGARALWTIGQAVSGLIPAIIAGVIAVACFQLLAGRAFDRVVVTMTLASAFAVTIGGLIAEIASQIAGNMASAELFTVVSAQYRDIPGIEDALAWWPDPTWGLTLPLWPIGAGLGLAALAAIFRYGSRLQRDTEGLV